jgi:hypothetical protein
LILLVLHFWTDFFRHGSVPSIECASCWLDGGNCFEENLSKTEGNRRIRPAFLHTILKFWHE